MKESYQKERSLNILRLKNNYHKEMCKQCKLSYYSMFHWGMCTFQILLSSRHLYKWYRQWQKCKLSMGQDKECKFHYCYNSLYCMHKLVLFYQIHCTPCNQLMMWCMLSKGRCKQYMHLSKMNNNLYCTSISVLQPMTYQCLCKWHSQQLMWYMWHKELHMLDNYL